ncbi:MAG: hypothetical protein QXI41_00420 [Candidatus Pacearchaeota archaeon]
MAKKLRDLIAGGALVAILLGGGACSKKSDIYFVPGYGVVSKEQIVPLDRKTREVIEEMYKVNAIIGAARNVENNIIDNAYNMNKKLDSLLEKYKKPQEPQDQPEVPYQPKAEKRYLHLGRGPAGDASNH